MKLAVMGLKGHENVVLAGARELGDVELVAVSEDDPEKLRRFQQKEPLGKHCETYADWRHLVEHTMMDVCCVSDENGVRIEQLIALIQRGVHVVAEKPLTTTLDDLQRLRRLHESSNARLSMLLTMRHEAKYAAMRDWILKGAIGEPCTASAQKSYRYETRPQWQKERVRLGGIIPYIGVHAMDLMRWLTGLEYTQVSALQANLATPEFGETEDHASVLLRFSNGGSATARLDYLRPMTAPSHGDDRVRVVGSEGIIEIAYPQNRISLVTKKRPPEEIAFGPTPNLFVDFVRSLREGREARITADDCFKATEIVLHARTAAETNTIISLPTKTRT